MYLKLIFFPKYDGEKWSRKNIFEIPPCARPFSDLLHNKNEDLGLKIQIQ